MFNPKQALERIRRGKLQKQERSNTSNILDQNAENSKELFPSSSSQQGSSPSRPLQQNASNPLPSSNVESRLAKLEALVTDLSTQLAESNDTIQNLRSNNSQLENQLIKLEYENSQLKSQSKAHEVRSGHRLNHSLNSVESKQQHGSMQQNSSVIRKVESKVNVVEQEYEFSPEVEDSIEEIVKNQTVDSILKRREQNFRALRNASKDNLVKGCKAFKELANLQRNYGKSFKKPTLIINLENADFE